MKVLGPRLINNDKYLLYIEETAMDLSSSRKRKLSLSLETESKTNEMNNASSAANTPVVSPRDPSARKPGGKRRRKPKVTEEHLGSSYKPSPKDVICARGKDAQNHPGNIAFRSMIAAFLEEYRQTQTKKEKTTIVCKIIESVRSSTPTGRFVRLHRSGYWMETGDDFAREKIGQCFRDRLHTEYRSSSKAKISRRKDSATQQTIKPMDFDEYVASASQEPEAPQQITSSSQTMPQRWMGSGGRSAQYVQMMQQRQHQQQQQQQQQHLSWGGTFPGQQRKRSNFQGLADMYFGDASSSTQSANTLPSGQRQQHLDLLGSLTQASRENLSTLKSTFSSNMDRGMEGGSHFGGGGGMSSFPQRNANSFASVPPNMYMKERRMSGFGFGGNFGGNPAMERPESQQQRHYGGQSSSSQQSIDHQKMANSGLDTTMSKIGFMQDAMWQNRSQRKPPPMPAAMFNADPLEVSGNPPPGEVTSIPSVKDTAVEADVAPAEGLDSSDQSSRVQDDEPLPLD